MITLEKLGAKAPKLILITFCLFGAACSLYQSDGRKFLARNALPLAGLAQRIELACQPQEEFPQDLQILSEFFAPSRPRDHFPYTDLSYEPIVINERTFLLAQSSRQLVVLLQSSPPSWCRFTYMSDQQKRELVDLDINLAMEHLSTFGQDR